MTPTYPILVRSSRMPPEELRSLVGRPFEGMVKFVADVDRRRLAVGGELHVDAKAVLLDQDSRQESLWGGNYWPGLGSEGCIEYISMINIRPAQGNRELSVQDPALRARIQALVFEILGRGEALP